MDISSAFYTQWDTGGQERYATMTQSFYRGADCCVLVYDKSNRASFGDVEKWWAELDRYTKPHTMRVLLATKSDLPEAVTKDEGEQLKRKLNVRYFYEVSAMKGKEGLDKLFSEWLTGGSHL
jgi:GTPase SAR1 family protein